MKRSDVELVLKQLTVEGVLRRLSGQTYERTLKPWAYPAQRGKRSPQIAVSNRTR